MATQDNSSTSSYQQMAGAVPIAGPIIGGGIGAIASAQNRAQANAAEQNAVAQWIQLNIPDPTQQQLALQSYTQTGQLTPAMEQAVKANPTSFQNITTNPQLQSAQMNALDSLQNEGMMGGMSLADQATMQDQLNNTNASAKGRNDAITTQFAQQGLGGSGLQMQAQLQNAQNATQNQGMNSLNAAAQSRQRALQSIMGAGQLGGQMQSQQYNQQSNLARAQDAINMYNTQNSQNTSNRNVDMNNAAQQYNIGMQQQISNANTALSNQQQMYNKGLSQQNYQNQIQKVSGLSNAQLGQANYLNNQANQTAGMYAGIGQGVGQIAAGYNHRQNANQSGDSGQSDGTSAGSGGATGAKAGSAGYNPDEENYYG